MTTETTSPLDTTVETETVVPTVVGELGAVVRVPAAGPRSLPGVVLADGSGDGDRHDWGGWPEWIAEAGSVVLRHDKPGCGGSPGHWTQQSMEDRARESLSAVRVLREHPATEGQPVGLYGISQGGWIALLAAALEPETVGFVVCHSGPGTTPAEQERDRLRTWLRGEGHDDDLIAEAMTWVDERLTRLRGAEDVEAILADQARFADRPWYPTVTFAYDSVANLRFLRRIMDFDPTTVMPDVRCPVLALFGGNDTLVPAQTSLRAFAEHLPPRPRDHGFAVFPGADHGLFTAAPRPDVARREQLAPGYLPLLTAFLARQRSAAVPAAAA